MVVDDRPFPGSVSPGRTAGSSRESDTPSDASSDTPGDTPDDTPGDTPDDTPDDGQRNGPNDGQPGNVADYQACSHPNENEVHCHRENCDNFTSDVGIGSVE